MGAPNDTNFQMNFHKLYDLGINYFKLLDFTDKLWNFMEVKVEWKAPGLTRQLSTDTCLTTEVHRSPSLPKTPMQSPRASLLLPF